MRMKKACLCLCICVYFTCAYFHSCLYQTRKQMLYMLASGYCNTYLRWSTLKVKRFILTQFQGFHSIALRLWRGSTSLWNHRVRETADYMVARKQSKKRGQSPTGGGTNFLHLWAPPPKGSTTYQQPHSFGTRPSIQGSWGGGLLPQATAMHKPWYSGPTLYVWRSALMLAPSSTAQGADSVEGVDCRILILIPVWLWAWPCVSEQCLLRY